MLQIKGMQSLTMLLKEMSNIQLTRIRAPMAALLSLPAT